MVNSCLGLDFISATSGVIWVGIVGMTRGMTPPRGESSARLFEHATKPVWDFVCFVFVTLETQDVCVSSDIIMMAKKREI
jgi:hypothetical protein